MSPPFLCTAKSARWCICAGELKTLKQLANAGSLILKEEWRTPELML
jgi:hypothetical protein